MSRTAAESLSCSQCLAGLRVAFTGKLASMGRRRAYELVRGQGGTPTSSVRSHTHLLIVGEEGCPLMADGRLARKLQLALRLKGEGTQLEILTETEWLTRLGLVDQQDAVSLALKKSS